jgi:hypothetical protein
MKFRLFRDNVGQPGSGSAEHLNPDPKHWLNTAMWRLSYDCLIYITVVLAQAYVCKIDDYLMRKICESYV